MRISDWSSDVCSSDLRRGGFGSCGPRARIGIQKCPAGIDDAGCAGADPARMESRNRSRSHHRGRHMTDQFQLTDDQLAIQDMARKFTADRITPFRSEEHTSELQSLMRISYAVFCLKKKTTNNKHATK